MIKFRNIVKENKNIKKFLCFNLILFKNIDLQNAFLKTSKFSFSRKYIGLKLISCIECILKEIRFKIPVFAKDSSLRS